MHDFFPFEFGVLSHTVSLFEWVDDRLKPWKAPNHGDSPSGSRERYDRVGDYDTETVYAERSSRVWRTWVKKL